MRTGRPFRVCVSCLAAVALVSPLRAQSPADARVLPPVSVEVVRIDVVVTDKGGHPKAGLAREDFAVLEDGVPQAVVQFEAYERRVAPAPSAPASSPATPAAPGPAPAPRPPRFVVLAVDDLHLEFGNMVRVQKALRRFIDEDMAPEDRLALVTTSGTQGAAQDLTSDRGLLHQAVSHLVAKDRRAEWVGAPHMTEYQAEMIERGDPDALFVAVQEILDERPNDPAEQEARRKARAILAEAIDNARLTLETVERLTRSLARLPGRKLVFLLSDGFVTGLTAPGGAAFDLRRVIDASTRAGVVVYSLDISGLTASSGLSASRRMVSPQTLGLKFMIERQGEEAARQAMNALAADTGGALFENSNDLHSGLKRTLEDTESYYVLAYEPTNTRRDGAFRRIEVRLPGLPRLKVRARTGYFAPGDRRARGSSPAPEEQERRPGGGSGEAPGPVTAIPVHLSADFVVVERGVPELVVSGNAEATTLSFLRQGDRYRATVEMAAEIRDETGAVTALDPERLAMDMSDAEHDRLSREGLPYQRTVALRSGRYDVRLTVRAAGALGVASQRVEIPDLAPGRLTLSSLFLLRARATGAADADPGATLVLSQARRRFRHEESLFVQLYAYNANRDASQETSLVAQAEVLREGVVLGTAEPEPMVGGEAEGPPVAHVSRIGLSRFEPGEYELQVTVTDQVSRETATRRVGFTIE